MHPYSVRAVPLQASELLDKVSGCRGEEQAASAAAVVAWLRLSAQRLLVWNRNYNVKPREISQAQVSEMCDE
jgi:hypothetical protein